MWAAAFLDGEGCISLNHHKSLVTLQIEIHSTDEWICWWYQMNFGGSVGRESKRMSGNGTKLKPQWYWEISCQKARRFLKAILPYLLLKNSQAELAIRFQDAKQGRQGKRLTLEEKTLEENQFFLMRELKQQKRLGCPTKEELMT